MPRTKVAKAVKRVREGEDPMEAHMKNFETRGKLGIFPPLWNPSKHSLAVNFIYQDIDYKFNQQFSKFDEELETFRNSIPVEILNMKVGDLKRMVRWSIFRIMSRLNRPIPPSRVSLHSPKSTSSWRRRRTSTRPCTWTDRSGMTVRIGPLDDHLTGS